MANPEHVKWLLKGVDAWNERRESCDFTPDLSGADIYSEFHEAGLIRPQWKLPLANVDLSGGSLVHTHLADADLTGADFTDAILTRADLTNANLTHAGLQGARLDNATLENANLTGATLYGTRLPNTNLTGANLTGAKLSAAELVDTDLTGAILTHAKPWKAILFPMNEMVPKPKHPVKAAIETIDDLLEVIREYEDHYGGSVSGTGDSDEIVLYFRGEPKGYRELRPSVMRTSRENRGDSESKMLRDLISRRPDEFNGMSSALAKWMLAQHHGIPTRFLDVTRNPLVALFFVCEDRKQDNRCENKCQVDGILHIFAVPRSLIKPFDSDTVSVIANHARLSLKEQELLLGKSNGSNSTQHSQHDYSEAMRRLYQWIRVEKAYFDQRIDPRDCYRVFLVDPQQSSERIRAQSGAFIASAFHERFERDEILKWNSEIPVYAHYSLTIPGGRKCHIMRDLQLLNITRETLFPGLDESAGAVKSLHLNGGGT